MAPKSKAAPIIEYDGPMEGEGKFYYVDGATYTGGWKMLLPPEDAPLPSDGIVKPIRVRQGHGIFQTEGYKYEGEFDQDSMNGTGTFTFASGASYTGDIPQYAGPGTYKDGNGNKWSGLFNQGSGPGLTYDIV